MGPDITPNPKYNGSSHIECNAYAGTWNAGSGPDIACVKTADTIAAKAMMPNALLLNSPIIISNAKKTPATGALKAAAIPPAAPAATRTHTRSSENRKSCPNIEPRFDPICTEGSSGPTDAPEPTDNDAAIVFIGKSR